eukprot:6645104-Prymnesium_polylepis.1
MPLRAPQGSHPCQPSRRCLRRLRRRRARSEMLLHAPHRFDDDYLFRPLIVTYLMPEAPQGRVAS